jgi:hypothetical protein
LQNNRKADIVKALLQTHDPAEATPPRGVSTCLPGLRATGGGKPGDATASRRLQTNPIEYRLGFISSI